MTSVTAATLMFGHALSNEERSCSLLQATDNHDSVVSSKGQLNGLNSSVMAHRQTVRQIAPASPFNSQLQGLCGGGRRGHPAARHEPAEVRVHPPLKCRLRVCLRCGAA